MFDAPGLFKDMTHAQRVFADADVRKQLSTLGGTKGVEPIAFLAHDIVVLLDPDKIVENTHTAYRHPAFGEKAYSVLMTGPSGSADIGGKEVHPAQGVMTLTVILWPEQRQK